MTRRARIVVPGVAHHVTQRGNRRAPIFFADGDQDVYRRLLAKQAAKAKVAIWAYCLMPNHVHLVLVPENEAGLSRAVGETHRRYTNFINARAGWTGHLFQSRFASVAMDEGHLLNAIRYVSLNPVRAGLAVRAKDWPWSSVRAHLAGVGDGLVRVRPVLDRIADFAGFLAAGDGEGAFDALRESETTGRPLGNKDFIEKLEHLLQRPIARRTPGRKPAQGTRQELLQ